MTNQGMTCAKAMVLTDAIFAFREQRPVHMPNQQSAAMFARIVQTWEADETTAAATAFIPLLSS